MRLFAAADLRVRWPSTYDGHSLSFLLQCRIVSSLGCTMQVRFNKDHQYVIVEDVVGTVGITKHAQENLSDVTLVELPHVGEQVKKGDASALSSQSRRQATSFSGKRRNPCCK